jgi:hypothetical protein
LRNFTWVANIEKRYRGRVERMDLSRRTQPRRERKQ